MTAAFVFGTLLTVACNDLTREQRRPNEAQVRAELRAARTRAKAAQQAQQESEARARAHAQREAERTLDQAKADIRASAEEDLDDLGARIDALRARSSAATGRMRSVIESWLVDIANKRSAVEARLRELDAATAAQIDEARERLNDELAEFKQSVNSAAQNI